jgi:hypothetical protein
MLGAARYETVSDHFDHLSRVFAILQSLQEEGERFWRERAQSCDSILQDIGSLERIEQVFNEY